MIFATMRSLLKHGRQAHDMDLDKTEILEKKGRKTKCGVCFKEVTLVQLKNHVR